MSCWFNHNFPHPDGAWLSHNPWLRCTGGDAVEVALRAIYGQPGMARGVRGKIKKVTEDCRGDIRPLSRHVKEWETGREKGDM